jgi:hypothetical protein
MSEEKKHLIHKMMPALTKEIRERIDAKIENLPDDILIEFGGGPKSVENIIDGRIQTDWPDSFDRNSWYKTWAKSGAENSLPSEVIAQRALQRQIEAKLKQKEE